MNTFTKYYRLTKPGIIRGNLMTATAGFLFASKGNVDISILFGVLFGVSLVIASGCVFNNYIDRDIDSKMERTKKRSIVIGDVSGINANIFACALGILGLLILYIFTNSLTMFLGIMGLFFYVVVYGYFKRKSVHGTLVGSISGAIPPVAGYTAVMGSLDLGAWLLFIILAVWQMPHFYAIAVYRRKDYEAAGIPILSVVKGVDTTRLHIITYIVSFAFVSASLYVSDYAGIAYLIAMLSVSAWWLKVAFSKLFYKNADKWAHSIFGVSLVVLLVFSLMISVDHFLF